MDLYRFFNSRDIAEHLRSIGHEFTASQAAYIVYKCENATLAEKIEAWKSIIAQMSNDKSPLAERYLPAGTAHELIERHISAEEGKLAEFLDGEGAVYFPYKSRWLEKPDYIPDEQIAEKGLWNTMSMPVPFETFEECVEYLRGISGRPPANWQYDRHVICRVRTNGSCACYEDWDTIEPINYPQDYVVLNGDFAVLSIATGWNEMPLDNILPAFPTPFEPGDIVIDRTATAPRPFVFCYAVPWTTEDSDEEFDMMLCYSGAQLRLDDIRGDADLARVDSKRLHELIEKWVMPCHFISCDALEFMGYKEWQTNTFGYEVDIRRGTLLFDKFGAARNYLNLEYYREPLVGDLRLLNAVSAYVRGKFGLDFVINYSHMMMHEREAAKFMRFMDDECDVEEAIAWKAPSTLAREPGEGWREKFDELGTTVKTTGDFDAWLKEMAQFKPPENERS